MGDECAYEDFGSCDHPEIDFYLHVNGLGDLEEVTYCIRCGMEW